MIKKEDLVKIGRINKPHGVKGEMTFTFTNDSFDESECPFLIVELDSIFVPFLLEDYRFKSDNSALINLKNVDSAEKARRFSLKDVFFLRQYIRNNDADSGFLWNYFIGFRLIDAQAGFIGEITDIDETTINVLFVVKQDENELLIPASEDLIARVDDEKKELHVTLPEGLLSL